MKAFCKIIFLFFLVNSINSLNRKRDCKCRILPQSKIIGGKQAHHLAYPWMVSISHIPDNTSKFLKIFIKDKTKINHHSCGGAIINEYWILTAGHCLPKDPTKSLYVGYGNDNDLAKIFDFGRIKSSRTIRYPKFGRNSITGHISHDIGLIKLETPIKFSENVKPACFLNENFKVYFGFLEHAGWGSTQVLRIDPESGASSESKIPKNLKEMFLVDKSDTHENCKYNDKIICAKGVFENESSCKGDSGGPAHYTKNGKSYVIGLTSYSNELISQYGLYYLCVGTTAYTRVSSFIDWIKHYVDEDICDF